MKRSEIIKLLAGYLSTLTIRSDIHPINYIGKAAEILSIIEEAGMEPPLDYTNHVCDQNNRCICNTQWEPEDD